MVTILNTDSQLKAATLADKLVWADITYRFEKVGVQYTIAVDEKDVRKAVHAAAFHLGKGAIANA